MPGRERGILQAAAAARDRRALGDGALEQVEDALELRARGERPEVGVLAAGADREVAEARDEALGDASWTSSWTRIRVVAKQDCPALRMTAAAAASTAASRSASGSTIVGDLPPSSRLTGTIRARGGGHHRGPGGHRAGERHVRDERVVDDRGAGRLPAPVTTATTPFGRPASSSIPATEPVDSGATSEGLTSTVLPAASAGATPRKSWLSGEFHGVMWATTPRARARVDERAVLARDRLALDLGRDPP